MLSSGQSGTRPLAALSPQKGYEIERSTIRDCYRLISADKQPLRFSDGSTGFTSNEAMAFLVLLPEVVTTQRAMPHEPEPCPANTSAP
jgi:hypothetical protein